MPNYQKKKVHRKALEGKTPVKESVPKEKKEKRAPKLKLNPPLKGTSEKVKKIELKHNTKVLAIIISVVVLTVLILGILSPVSLNESFTNALNVIGSGSYPIGVSDSQIIDGYSYGAYYYVLTDSSIRAYSNSGKEIYSAGHGFSNPCMCVSDSRALVFDQGGKSLIVTNLSKITNSFTSDSAIITAAIARNGTYAVAAKTNGYTSKAIVYNKNNKKIYEWNCAKDYINNLAISPNGKKIAITTVNASGGQFVSKLYVFECDKVNSVFSRDLNEAVPLLLCSNKKGFSLVTDSGYSFFDWSKYGEANVSNDYSLGYFRQSSGNILLVFNRVSNLTDNLLVVLNSKGKKVSEFNFNGAISDIQIKGNHIYCISETSAYLFDRAGKLLKTGKCPFGCIKLSPLGSKTVALITDNGIEKFEIDDEVAK